MTKKIYVGNLPFTANEEEIRTLFAAHGNVHSVTLISDRETGRPRGFGFVEMDDDTAQAAIDAINGTELGGRTLNVNEARERKGGGQRGGGGRRDY
ncbi:MAG: RNA-binding protein [Candidatus Krumholzibacteria bacterium]|nr:RNA-binding protein [Candidatus Krumholzibacteria bacterium]